MPKATKDVKKEELKKEKKVSQSIATAKKSTTKSTKKTTVSSTKKQTVTKSSTDKKTNTTKTSTNKTKKYNTAKKVSKSTSSTTNKKTTTTRKKSTSVKKVENNVVAEYYDLPYRYNETIVKILYQTPNVLFVYWDISDDDRNKFNEQYGENFFYDTKPILKIFNLTKNYNFEMEINDFANSWYINVNDANSSYKVELARKPIQYNSSINSDYIYVSSSNYIQFPNDHILLEELPNKINFKNIKTNKITSKDIGTLRLIGINRIYNIYDFYKKLYKDEILEEINNKKLINPSSSSWN